MQEQIFLKDRFNAFTLRWGLKTTYIADKLTISLDLLYRFKSGRALLTKSQTKKLEQFMDDYEKRNGANLENEQQT